MELLVAHSGGPSTTLNAGLVGLIDACRDEGEAIRIWGARHGAAGVGSGDWVDLSAIPAEKLEAVMRTPGSVLGASRRAVFEEEAPGFVRRLAERGIGALIYAGGNGTMAAAALLAKTAAETRVDLKVIGLPNTVDNDVTCTDHTPGFASAARFQALAVRDINEDNRALPSPITVVESIGRNAGWVAAASALGRSSEDDGPHLIYLPEHQPEEGQIYADVRHAVRRFGRAVVVVCEGLRDASGRAFDADLDCPGERAELARNLAHVLARKIQMVTGLRARAERPGLLGRSCSWAISETDVEESYRCGRAAAETALGGSSGVLIALRRQPGLVYRSFPHATPFSDNPGRERRMPKEWVGEPGTGGTADYLEWLSPLVGEIPPVERIL
jgi:6-phosphofructokinase 1